MPTTASIPLRQFVEALFISHAETSLNNDGHFYQMISKEAQMHDNDLTVLSSKIWCQDLIQR